MLKSKTLTVVGHRPKKLSGYTSNGDIYESPMVLWVREMTKQKLENYILQGYDTLVCGMAPGGDQIGAEAWIELKSKYPHLKLIAAIPYENQPDVWGLGAKARYNKILEACDERYLISPNPISDADARTKLQTRNVWMMDRVSLVMAIWDGTRGGTANGVMYAQLLKPAPKMDYISPKWFK